MKNKNKEFFSIDLFKFIMAILVVINHTNPLANCTNKYILNLYRIIINVAAPYFFIASGYLIFKKINIESKNKKLEYIKKYLQKIIKLYLIWNIIYLPITIYGFVISGDTITICFIKFIRGFIFIGEQYYSWPLWYLLALIYIYGCIYMILKFSNNEKNIFIIMSVICLFGILMSISEVCNIPIFDTVKKLVDKIFANKRIFVSFGYVLVGMLLSIYYYKLKINTHLLTAFIIISLLISNLISTDLYVFLYLIVSSLLFLISLNLNDKIKINGLKLRFYSQVIYFIHMIYYFIYNLLIGKNLYIGFDVFLITLLFSLVTGYILFKLRRRYMIIQKIF